LTGEREGEYNHGGMLKNILLLLLIIVIAAFGLVWFDYLGVIDVKTKLAPVFNLLGMQGRSQPDAGADEALNLDSERLAVLNEAIVLKQNEMNLQEAALRQREAEIAQMAAELEERQKGLDEREKSMKEQLTLEEIRSKNIEQNARYLNGMPPESAVAILIAMDDQQAIDVLRKTEEIAKAEGTASIVSYWFSLLAAKDAGRAAELQRKMAEWPAP